MTDSRVRSTPEVPRRVDYLLAAMGFALFGGLAVGVVSAASLEVAAGGGSALAACLLAVGLVRYPRQLLPSAAPSSRRNGRDDGDDRNARGQ
jgi:hypothetical protein